MKQWSLLAGFALLLTACHDGPTALPRAKSANQSTVLGARRYIVRFRNDVQDASGLADQLVAAP